MLAALQPWLGEVAALAALAAVAVAALYLWFSRRFAYWAARGVAHRPPIFPFGNIKQSLLGRTRFEFVVQDIYNELRGEKCFGMYGFSRPLFVLRDPDLIRLVLVKDFDAFNHRGVPYNDQEPLNHNLFFLAGAKWKRLRSKLTPTFTTGKLKMMCQRMQECGRELVAVLAEAASRGDVVEVREVSARYATDVIASVAFGVECNCQRNPDAEFRQWGRKVFEPTLKSRVAMLMRDFLPAVAKLFRIGAGTEEVSQYFRSMVRETVEYREQQGASRSDFMQLLIQLKNRGCVDDERAGARSDHSKEPDNWKLSLDDVAAQAFIFFVAGFETSSTTMSLALYELAVNPDVQRRLQQELDVTLEKSAGQLTYEAINEMPYLDKVVAETLRKYPPGAILVRKCMRQYQFPNGGPLLDEGITVVIPTYALHHDPEYFPEPDRFDPERFSEEQKAKIHPYVYLPFGEGPRNCIGMRLGLLQTKIGLAYLMSKYQVERCEHTKVPIEFNNVSFIPMPAGGVQLRLAKRA